MELKNNIRKAKCIAVFGTGSDVGKSIIATALCRYFKNKGLKVVPFKAQNMSNNSGITPEGLEMGRAQIVQAEAAGISPHVDMNPVLLKPTSEIGAQVILLGKVYEDSTAAEYHKKKKKLFSKTSAALDRLRESNDVVIIEGAGSCAEVNLMPHDIVNFRTAEYADADVILAVDIHKGGVFAQIVGTLACLSEKQQNMIQGFIVNRFKGDITLFKNGIEWIEQKTSRKVFGVLPWYNHIKIDPEDSVVIENPKPTHGKDDGKPRIAVVRIPHISNFTDFEPLSNIKDLHLDFVEKPFDLSGYAAIILPGSKNTRFDLNWLIENKWDEFIIVYSNNGGHVFGICGGYQMMGNQVHDPDGLEGTPGSSKGLSLIPVETTLKAPKTTTITEFTWNGIKGLGYEIHMGHTKIDPNNFMLKIIKRNHMNIDDIDGCLNENSNIMGTYIHGFFDSMEITKHWLDSIGLNHLQVPGKGGLAARDHEYDLLLKHFEKHVDVGMISELAGM